MSIRIPRLAEIAAVAFAAALPALAQQSEAMLPKPREPSAVPSEERRAELAKRLCEAIDAGDPDAFERALLDGADPDLGMGAGTDDTRDRTPLIHAVLVGRRDFVDRLFARGARLDGGDAKEHTPLMYAALVDDATTAAHLVRLGARVDAVDEEGRTAASYATKSKALADQLATAEQRHRTLLEVLVQGNAEKAVELVEGGASPNANNGRLSLLMHAVVRGDLDLTRTALRLGARADLPHVHGFSFETPLGLAAAGAALPLLELLLDQGKLSQESLDDALASAAGAALDDRLQRIRILLAAGADPSWQSLTKTPALAAAAAAFDLESMRALLLGGADRASADLALMRAAGLADEDRALELTLALLDVGADPDADWMYTNALGEAAEQGHVRVMARIADRVTDETYSAAVAQVARAGRAAGLRWLCEHGKGRIDFDFAPGVFDPPLVAAIGQDGLDCVDVLLAAGAPAEHAPSMSCDSPLVEAVRGQKYAVIEKLLAAGADPRRRWQAPLREPLSAIDVAEQMEDERALALLRAVVDVLEADRDPVGRTLARCGLNFEELPTMYRLVYSSSDTGRSHAVYVRKAPEAYEDLRIQEIYGLCYDQREKPSAATIRRVFARAYAIGGLVLEAPSEGQPNWRIRFRVEVPVDTTPERLRTCLDVVQSTADEIEREIDPAVEDRL